MEGYSFYVVCEQVTLRCAQPRSGAALSCAVVHLQSCEVTNEARTGTPLPLAETHEVWGEYT
jgi:hypothetical protein